MRSRCKDGTEAMALARCWAGRDELFGKNETEKLSRKLVTFTVRVERWCNWSLRYSISVVWKMWPANEPTSPDGRQGLKKVPELAKNKIMLSIDKPGFWQTFTSLAPCFHLLCLYLNIKKASGMNAGLQETRSL